MVKRLLLLFTILGIISCTDNGNEDEAPSIEGEMITNIQSYNSEGVIIRKYNLYNDGSKFTSYSRYDLNSEGQWEFFQSVDFSYDEQSRLTEARFFFTEDRANGVESKFGYDWGTDSYVFNRYQLNQNHEFYIDSYEEYPYNLPQNGYRELNGYIYGFENGNFVGMGGEDQNGSLEEFGKTWNFNQYLIYDENPNFQSDHALNFTLGQRNLFSSFNANNQIAYRYPQGNLENYNYEIQNGKVTSISYEDGSRLEFSYIIDEE